MLNGHPQRQFNESRRKEKKIDYYAMTCFSSFDQLVNSRAGR
jgi:hypothetical protein